MGQETRRGQEVAGVTPITWRLQGPRGGQLGQLATTWRRCVGGSGEAAWVSGMVVNMDRAGSLEIKLGCSVWTPGIS